MLKFIFSFKLKLPSITRLKCLILSGADVNLMSQSNGNTALHAAIEVNYRVAELLYIYPTSNCNVL